MSIDFSQLSRIAEGAEEPVEPRTREDVYRERELANEVSRLTLQQEAKRIVAAQGRDEDDSASKFSGGSFILDAPDHIESLWGEDPYVLWSKGEPFMLAGQMGTGKTTIAQQLVLGLIGTPGFSKLLGANVVPLGMDRTVLYLAMDRPIQARRSFRRMVDEGDRAHLDERLHARSGPLPAAVVQDMFVNPFALADWIVENYGVEVGAVVVDSVKDLMPGLKNDEEGSAVNSQWQGLMERGIELLDLHHDRKSSGGEGRNISVDSVYGSTWLTSGHGSIMKIMGEPGDEAIELFHIKQPGEVVGPIKAIHDHPSGRTVIDLSEKPLSAVEALANLGGVGTTAAVGLAMFPNDEQTRNTKQKTKRALEKAVEDGSVSEVSGGGKGREVQWRLLPILMSNSASNE